MELAQMDISALKAVNEDDGVLVHLKDAAGKLMYDGEASAKTPVTIRVAGTYSARYRKAWKVELAAARKANRDGAQLDPDAVDEIAEDRLQSIEAQCILDWTFTSSGKAFPINPENWKALVASQPQWQDQLRVAMNDHERFFTES